MRTSLQRVVHRPARGPRPLGVFCGVVCCGLAAALGCSTPSATPDGNHDARSPASDAPIPSDDTPRMDAWRPDSAVDAGYPSGLRPFAFARGVNPGSYGPGIDRRESAMLSRGAGVQSLRTPLPERYLAQWGPAIEVEDYAYYQSLGIDQHVVFLIGPRREHSTAPSGVADWELDHYAPSGLHEPIFLADGSVNPENHWASYVASVAQHYGARTAIYEVWNEPDQISDWRISEQWATEPPTAAQLRWWNASIFDYIRALRITHEVVHRFDAEAQVTVGGVGYPNFLRAVLRYTDEPTRGAVDAAHPATGGAYLDCLSFHYYPVFSRQSSDPGVDGLLRLGAEMRGVLRESGLELPLMVTETGAPRVALPTSVGGADYAAAYLLKAMILGPFEGWLGIHWFAQGDGQNTASDAFASMGLYYDYAMASSPSDARRSPQGDAYAWLAPRLDDTAGDPEGLEAFALPSGVRGAAFRRSSGARVLFVWARTDTDESATVDFALHTTTPVRVHAFHVDRAASETSITPTDGIVTLRLDGTPQLIELD